MTDCKCGHYKTNHERQRDTMCYDGKCRGQTGCAGHEPCSCKAFNGKTKWKCNMCINTLHGACEIASCDPTHTNCICRCKK